MWAINVYYMSMLCNLENETPDLRTVLGMPRCRIKFRA